MNRGGFLPSDLPSEGNINSDVQTPSTGKFAVNGGVKVARCSIKLVNSGEVIDGKVSINNSAFNYVRIMGCVRSSRQTSNGAEMLIEDGTGSVSVRVFQDKAPDFDVKYF